MLLHALIKVFPKWSSPAAWLPSCLGRRWSSDFSLWGRHQADTDTQLVLNSPGEVPLHPRRSGRSDECLAVRNAREHQPNVGSEKSQQRPPRTLLRCAPCSRTRSLSSRLRGEGSEQMGRDLLQSHTEAVTKLRQEGRVTSCSVHPRRTTGTVPAPAASNYLQLPPCVFGRESRSRSAPARLQLGGRGAALTASPSIAPARCAAARSNSRLSSGGFRWRRTNLFTSGDWRHLKVGRSNWHLMSRLSRGREKQGSEQGRHLLASVPPAVPVLPAAQAELNTH